MMIRKILFIMIMLLCSASVIAADFDGYKYSGDRFTLGDDEFMIRLSNDEDLLSFKSDKEFITVSKGNCESTQYYKYCFNETKIDFDEDLGKLHDYTGEVMPAIRILMTDLQAELKVTRSVTSTSPKQYEPITVTVSIKNEGKKEAKIKYIENISLDASLESCKGCTIIGDQVHYIATIYRADEKEFSYRINPQDAEELSLVPTLDYSTDINNGTVAIKTIKIVPKKSLSVTYGGSKKLIIEKVQDSTFTFRNDDPENRITYRSMIKSDNGIDFESTDSGVETQGDSLIFEGRLDPGESEEYSVDILGKQSGKREYVMVTEYDIGSENLRSNQSFEFEINIEKPVFEFMIDKNVFSDVMETLELNIDNYGSSNSFKNMDIRITLPAAQESNPHIIEENFIIPFLKFGREVKAYKKDFIMHTDLEKKLDATLDIIYDTIYGEPISYSYIEEITLKPIAQIASVEHNVEDYKQDDGSLLVSAFIVNNHEDTLVFDIEERIEGMDIRTIDERELADYTKLTESVDFYITSLSKKQVFNYMLKQKENSTGDIYTELSFSGVTKDYRIIVHSVVDFEKKTISVEDTEVEIELGIEKDVVFNSTGVIEENIELEKTHSYEPEETSTDQGSESTSNEDSSEPETSAANDASDLVDSSSQEKGFWQKVIDVIMSFF